MKAQDAVSTNQKFCKLATKGDTFNQKLTTVFWKVGPLRLSGLGHQLNGESLFTPMAWMITFGSGRRDLNWQKTNCL